MLEAHGGHGLIDDDEAGLRLGAPGKESTREEAEHKELFAFYEQSLF